MAAEPPPLPSGMTPALSVLDLVPVRTGQTSAQAVASSLALAARAGQLLMFHAGAVAHPETGRALVFVAPGGTARRPRASTIT